jgi:hypothetical protein
MRFDTQVTVLGPLRSPAQMLAEQVYDGHASVHDADSAAALGLLGAPIEGPTHFSQIDPLAFVLWGPSWFERGCISSHFRTMVVEGEQVQASLTPTSETSARIEAHKQDGTPVLTGTASIGPDHGPTELDVRRAGQGDPGELFIVDQLEVGKVYRGKRDAITAKERNGNLYPFSLAEKLESITEPHPWYTEDGASSSPWGRPIVPMEMLSVLANKAHEEWAVRRPSMGLFLDLEVKLINGPVFVGQEYTLDRQIVGLSQSRRTESFWIHTTIREPESEDVVAEVLLHSGVFKESYAGYPADRLG